MFNFCSQQINEEIIFRRCWSADLWMRWFFYVWVRLYMAWAFLQRNVKLDKKSNLFSKHAMLGCQSHCVSTASLWCIVVRRGQTGKHWFKLRSRMFTSGCLLDLWPSSCTLPKQVKLNNPFLSSNVYDVARQASIDSLVDLGCDI